MATHSNDEKIRLYFLGQLPEAVAENFEEDISQDEEMFAEAEIVERELIDDYVRGSLERSEREAFETQYLTSDARRERLALTESIWGASKGGSKTLVVEPTSPSFWSTLRGWRLAVVVSCIILLTLAFPIFMLYIQVQTRTESADAEEGFKISIDQSETPLNPAVDARDLADSSTVTAANGSASPGRAPTPSPPERISPTIATVSLAPGALRDEGEQTITVTPITKSLDLRLLPAAGSPQHSSYTATLKTADGETVMTFRDLRSPRIQVPAVRLQSRTYVLFLEGLNPQNEFEPIAEYTFRVRR